jgi:hypothetical protein
VQKYDNGLTRIRITEIYNVKLVPGCGRGKDWILVVSFALNDGYPCNMYRQVTKNIPVKITFAQYIWTGTGEDLLLKER